MKKIIFTIMFLLLASAIFAQDTIRIKQHSKDKSQQHRMHFVDENGDGYNDNAPDHDGDGIPNGLDPDWHKLHKGKGKGKGQKHKFVDLDGDGINDYIQTTNPKKGKQQKMLKDQNRQGGSMDKQSKGGERHRGDKKGGKH